VWWTGGSRPARGASQIPEQRLRPPSNDHHPSQREGDHGVARMTGKTPETNRSQLEAELERAWADTAHTRAQLPEHDVNQVLAAWYDTSKPLVFTRTMLWDVEVRKAYNPGDYI